LVVVFRHREELNSGYYPSFPVPLNYRKAWGPVIALYIIMA
jgi:hypothetical protein